ncbi:MAG: PLP-dependent transferase [Rhodocyclales bacterium]|nr:PLP-dependent transferase [Rhodocyclales bacterium]
MCTQLVHPNYVAPEGFSGVQPGQFSASTVFFRSAQAYRERNWCSGEGYIYGSHGTPTTFALESRISALEGVQYCLLYPSGLNAIAQVFLALLKPGDELLVPINVYPAVRMLVLHELVPMGIGCRLYDPTNLESLLFARNTKLIWVEAACSITFEFPDVEAIAARAKESGVVVGLDNTWGAGIALDAYGFGIDISVQALTKYPCGSADVIMGSVTTQDRELYTLLQMCRMRFGVSVSARDASVVLSGMNTLRLRYEAHDSATRKIVEWANHRREFHRVLHPTAPDAVGQNIWLQHCSAAAGLFSVVFKPEYNTGYVDKFIDSLRLFRIGVSWGGPVSLVLSFDRNVASVTELPGVLVRFCIGLEDVDDLITDLEQALFTASQQ